MQLLRIECLGKELRLEGSMAGWQQLFWDNQCVSQINAQATDEQDNANLHQFTLQSEQGELSVMLDVTLTWQPFKLDYCLAVNGQEVSREQLLEQDIAKQEVAVEAVQKKAKFSVVGLAALGFKLLKSAKVIKVLFAAGSLAAYSWLFSPQFAVALILCLVFHEYGHIKAMKYFGLKTKGIYLIPFLGGLAMSDEKINTRWQDVVISIMGPFFGLILSVVCLIAYWVTGLEILAGLAAFNALINLFQLLPILPLDGGHILKSIAFSVNSTLGLLACIAGAIFGIFISYYFGLALLGFLLLIGSVEIIFEYKQRHQSSLLPLNRYAQVVASIWYVGTVAALGGIIVWLAQSGIEALALPAQILSS
ncbi:MAG: site-2 protease family protein [Psychrobium sp.]|nr:site-2 protease family protein [Psychrobium sp.]